MTDYVIQRRTLTPFLSKKVTPVPEEDERQVYPEAKANILSRIFFVWMLPLLNVGYKRTLEPDDLYILPDNYKVEDMTARFYVYFTQDLEKSKRKHILAKCKERGETTSSVDEEEDLRDFTVSKWVTYFSLMKTFKYKYLVACVICAVNGLLQCLGPLLTRQLIKFVEYRSLGIEDKAGKGVGYAIGSVFMVLVAGFCVNHAFYRSMMIGAMMKAVVTKALLEKSFKINPRSKHDYPVSKITSMMGTDAARIDFAMTFQPFLVVFPISLVAIIVVLIVNIGVSALAGIGFLLLFLVGIGFISKKAFAIRGTVSKSTDLRVDYIKEILNNLKVLKFYSWEEAYHKNVSDVRTKEMKTIYLIQLIRNFTTAAAVSLSLFASLVAFLVLYATGSGKRSAANIFSSVSLFNVFTSLVFVVPMALSSLSDALIGIERIGNFLACPELAENEGIVEASDDILDDMDKRDLAVRVANATFEWDVFGIEEDDEDLKDEKDEKDDAKKAKIEEKLVNGDTSNASTLEVKKTVGLNNLDFEVRKGEFVVITGLIGSGKSSLLNAISGFMKRVSGEVDINGSLVLCGQPWIQNTTVKENILFGSEFDDEKYKQIIYSCSLESDLEVLPAGDRTEIGERGITLSGGQKARINLARSVYGDRDIVLLDDVLSAVDARVGKHIMENCILGLLKDKTRFLATHQLSLIGAADRIIFMNGDGTVSIGTPDDLSKFNEGFRNLMTFSTQQDDEDEEEEKIEDQDEKEAEKELIQRQITRASTNVTTIDEEAIHRDYNQDLNVSGKLSDDETKAVNGIGWNIYRQYAQLGGGIFKYNSLPVIILFLMALATFSFLFTSTWLSFWTEYKFKNKTDGFYIGIYVMMTVCAFILMFILFTTIGYLTNQASTKLNILAIEKILYAPMSFLDTTPMGRIMNRFTKDTDVLDNEVADQMRFFLFSLSNIVGVVILCIIYLPWFAIAVPPFVIGAYLVAEYYRASALEVKRLEAVQRSFVYNNFNETLVGMDTIKAYQSERRFLDKNDNYIDRMNEAYYISIAAQRWVGINLELVGGVLPIVVTLLSVFRVFSIGPASVGLVTSFVIQIAGQIAFLVRGYTQVETAMNSTERLCDFAFGLPSEAPYYIPETAPPSDWPQKGSIVFKDASMAYRPGLPLVLKDLNIQINPQEKIGICGRTGAGKSSIVTSLYRLSELDSGQIFIDDVDISKLGLKALRSKLSIIPQDPVLFKGTIRKNLDPFGESSDSDLWDSLRRAGLIDASRLDSVRQQDKHDANLDKFHLSQNVEDDGSNFSLGERQLLALARALVRDSKILILDEATSSVDYETDAKIQETIVSEFGGCTILCIAHRLKTIVNYHKILVLDKGEVEEFDTPWNLFNKEGGIFQQMCLRSKITAEDFLHKP